MKSLQQPFRRIKRHKKENTEEINMRIYLKKVSKNYKNMNISFRNSRIKKHKKLFFVVYNMKNE